MLLLQPQIHWPAVTALVELCGFKRPKAQDLAAFLRLHPLFYRCVTLTFVVSCGDDTLIQILTNSSLKAAEFENNSGRRLAVLTADVDEWQRAIQHFCSLNSTMEARSVFDSLYKEFDKLGLTFLWGKVKAAKDGTFYLENKK
jgi:hypothetical protein